MNLSFYYSYSGTDMLQDFLKEPSRYFENFCRMHVSDFELLLTKIGPAIKKQDTNMRKSIPIEQRLAITLRFLATGDSFTSLGYLFKCSRQTVKNCVMEVCENLIKALKDEIKVNTLIFFKSLMRFFIKLLLLLLQL